jgi:hypothetical protein
LLFIKKERKALAFHAMCWDDPSSSMLVVIQLNHVTRILSKISGEQSQRIRYCN